MLFMKHLITRIKSEATAEILGNMINDQQFLNSLATSKANVFTKLWAKVNELIARATGSEKAFLNSIKAKMKIAMAEAQSRGQNNYQESLSYSKYNKIERSTETNLDKYKSSTLFNQMMQKSKYNTDETMLVNDYNNYYLIDKYANNEYDIRIKIPIEGNEEFIKEMERKISDYARVKSRDRKSNRNANGFERRQSNNNRAYAPIQREQTWSEFIDEVLERQGKERNNNKRNSTRGIRDRQTDTQANEDIRYSKNTTSQEHDNKGRTLTQSQAKFFKDSKARDDNGNLVTVYHTMTDEGVQFNEFNPVGTDHYRFGDQVVNYYTDSKEMSGSYADQNYQMADTKRITTLKEVNDYIKEYNELHKDQGKNVVLHKTGDSYELIDNRYIPLFRESTIQAKKNMYCKSAELRQIRVHDFRHSCASLLINKGASIALVSKYLGHSNISITLDTYTHMFKSELKNMTDILNKL